MLAEGADGAAVLLSHNRPSGNPEPSRENVAVSKQLVEAGKVIGIPVHGAKAPTRHTAGYTLHHSQAVAANVDLCP